LIGEASDELARSLDRAGREYARAGDLSIAVEQSSREAEPGAVVLLSPACASFDQFRNFEERGEAFRRLVEALR
jgi:UDP-N-acetylmuramoylalanine--D-glutamate ligase